MKNLVVILFFALSVNTLSSQNMDNSSLEEIFKTMSDTIQGKSGSWQFTINDVLFVCITDTNHNRMRIISPITKANVLTEDEKSLLLLANFHTVLDVKYAISDDVLWSVFILPLKELTTAQVKDAVNQIYSANITFGTSYSSTNLLFPGKAKKEAKQIKKNSFKKKT